MTQDKLKHLLGTSATKPPIQRGKPLELSTEAPALPDTGDSAKTHHRTIASAEQYKRVNRGYKLREDLIKACKLRALEQDKMLYEVMEEALLEYLEGTRTTALESEVQRLQERLNIEQRFRLDAQVHHFKKWLRTHDQPQDSDFFNRFLADTRLPQHASRALYAARLKQYGYSDEDIFLFQERWKDMLFT